MKLGIVGSGAIVSYTIDVFQHLNMEVSALWCREQEKEGAKQLCEHHGVPKIYTEYDQFLKDDQIEVVYLGIINSLHYIYAKQALLAGKHVICEKPLTATGEQARELMNIAKEQHEMLFECMMPRYTENYESIKDHLSELGDIKMIYCNYSQYSSRYDAYRNKVVLPAFDPNLAGGALYDINVYGIQFVMDLFHRPKEVQYFPNIGYNGIDTSGVLLLDYGTFKAVCSCAKDSNSPARVIIQGEHGYMEMSSMPGCVKNVHMVLHKKERVLIDVLDFDDARGVMFGAIKGMIEQGEYEKSYQFIEKSVIAMEVMEEARKKAGIYFGGERKEIQ